MASASVSAARFNIKNTVFLLLLTISCVSFLAAIGLIYFHIDYQNDIVVSTKKKLYELTVTASNDIANILQQTMNDADAIANKLTLNNLSASQALKSVKTLLDKNPNYYGSAISYRPFGYDSKQRLFSPYYKKSGNKGKLSFVQIETLYDYTKPEFDWFVTAMQLGSRWSEPYWGPAGNAYMVTYSSVFYDTQSKSKTPLGVVTIDISMNQIKKLIEDIDLGPSGFGALLSAKGVYLYHPITEYVISQKNIIQVAKDKNDEDRLLVAKMAAKGLAGTIDHISTTTGQASWLIFNPIELAGWSLQNTFLKNDIEIDVDSLRQQLIWIVFTVLTFLLTLLAIIFLKIRGYNKRLWLLTCIGSVLIICAIGSIWFIALSYNSTDKIKGIRISDKATLHSIMKEHTNNAIKKHLKPPIYVPTGVFIDYIKFSGPSDVLLSGYIWQKYRKDFPTEIKKTFMISKATNISIKEIDRSTKNGYEVILSYFKADLRQKFTHETYPLEQELIALQIIHKNLDHNIILMPDLDAYSIRNASYLPGLDSTAFILGWTLTNSYYELRQRNLNTNFGIQQSNKLDDFPVLFYNIDIQRNFIDAFISNLTPLIIVSIMLFFILFLVDKMDTERILSICVAMIFVIVFTHIDIRRKISAQEIFYLEYFFFLSYGSILYVALNTMGVLLKTDIWPFHAHSQTPRLLFWPVMLGLTFVVTITTFY